MIPTRCDCVKADNGTVMRLPKYQISGLRIGDVTKVFRKLKNGCINIRRWHRKGYGLAVRCLLEMKGILVRKKRNSITKEEGFGIAIILRN